MSGSKTSIKNTIWAITIVSVVTNFTFGVLNYIFHDQLSLMSIILSIVIISLSVLITAVMPHVILRKDIEKPLSDLSKYLDTLMKCLDGRDDCEGTCDGCVHNIDRFDTVDVKEFDEVKAVLNSYSATSIRSKNLSKRTEQTLWELAHTDSMTGAGNRYRLHNDWEGLLTSPIKTSRMNVCLAIVDANKFKKINDTHGHKAGDDALIAITDTIKNTLRSGDSVYRLGGDEFVVMLMDTTMDDAIDVMARCSYNIKTFDHKSINIDNPLEVSVGLVHVKGPFTSESLEVMLNRADKALYEAKVSSHIHIDKDIDKKFQCVSIPAKAIVV